MLVTQETIYHSFIQTLNYLTEISKISFYYKIFILGTFQKISVQVDKMLITFYFWQEKISSLLIVVSGKYHILFL